MQALIVVSSRELALQIESVFREMGSGFKVNAIYGGRAGAKDKVDLQHKPAVLVGTPGRLADHIRRESFSLKNIKTLVLDEFDKSLEIGFDDEMIEILNSLYYLERKILTSATKAVPVPDFAEFNHPKEINFLAEKKSLLETEIVETESKDRLDALMAILHLHENDHGIIFCNFKETIQFVGEHLQSMGMNYACFQGGMEQKDRERSLIKFRNGTHNILIATDLAARGIDVPELKYIIHFQLPHRSEEFTHRNGRTARMNKEGKAYLLKWKNEKMPDYINLEKTPKVSVDELPKLRKVVDAKEWTTLYISGGRKDKISKGDIAGLFIKKGNLKPDEVGAIELKTDCAFVAVTEEKADALCQQFNNTRLKTKKVRVGRM